MTGTEHTIYTVLFSSNFLEHVALGSVFTEPDLNSHRNKKKGFLKSLMHPDFALYTSSHRD